MSVIFWSRFEHVLSFVLSFPIKVSLFFFNIAEPFRRLQYKMQRKAKNMKEVFTKNLISHKDLKKFEIQDGTKIWKIFSAKTKSYPKTRKLFLYFSETTSMLHLFRPCSFLFPIH